MAIYVPPSTRRRRLVVLGAAALVVGLLLGFGVGRSTSSGVGDAVDDVREQAEGAAVSLQRIPIEYSQATAGEGGESTATITEALGRARAQLDAAWDDASWFGPGVREPVDDALEVVGEAIADGASAEDFQAAIDHAVEAVEAAFGVTVEGAG